MGKDRVLTYVGHVINNMPMGWLETTTHRLDIYDESLAKTQFLDQFVSLYNQGVFDSVALSNLPTAYDYIRLGHPLSCVLEWTLAKLNHIDAQAVISFSSKTIAILAILRRNLLVGKETNIYHTAALPEHFDLDLVRSIYGYKFQIHQVQSIDDVKKHNGSTIYIENQDLAKLNYDRIIQYSNVDFHINIYEQQGSILFVNGTDNKTYITDIQHVRRRETIAMTPANCQIILESITGQASATEDSFLADIETNRSKVKKSIEDITGSSTMALVGSSGLSIQYAIMMGLIHDAKVNHKGKEIRFVVPPNCYGGTNDQARRVAACIDNVSVVDLPVDGGNDMVQSIEIILEQIAKEDAIPYIIAEIPTNPRVEVPDLQALRATLLRERFTANGDRALDPVFILDQTFCPNVLFLGKGEVLSKIRTISYASGSKFPSGGLCTAGYCVGNSHTIALMHKIDLHLKLCDNEATGLQLAILADQLPSMNQRINDAYLNTRKFVNFIKQTLPEAKINFVSDDLAAQGFTPSVFSLDLPTKGNSEHEREAYKRELNLKLINLMITEIPNESKFCVSYGQLKGCYWTVPATSTQGTTKEGDKDYIVRASLSANMDLEHHQKVFQQFVNSIVL